MKVAEIFAELGFKVQGESDLKSFETSLQNIAQAARNAALALKVLARTQVPKQLGQVVKQQTATSSAIKEVEKATGIKASDVVQETKTTAEGSSVVAPAAVEASTSVVQLAVVLKALARTAREASSALLGSGQSQGSQSRQFGQFGIFGPPVQPQSGQVQSGQSTAPQATPQPPVPNIPPGVYGQNVLHGPPPPSSVPPVLNQPGTKPGNGLPVAVLQGFKALGSIGLKVFGITTVALALKKLVSALAEMVKASMQAAFTMDKFTYQTGMSRRELKEWEHVAALSDVREEELQDSLKRMQQLSRQIRYTGEGATPFLQLGIDPMASPSKIMKQFAERTRHMDTATAVYWGSLIGLSDNMVYMLRKNADQLNKLFPNAELSDAEYQNVTELSRAWKELTYTIGLLKDKITSDLAPALKWILDKITSVAQLFTMSKDFRDWGYGQLTSGGVFNPQSLALPIKLLRASFGGKGNTTHVENNVDVKVDGSGRPNDAARATAKEVSRTLEKAYYGSQAATAGAQP